MTWEGVCDELRRLQVVKERASVNEVYVAGGKSRLLKPYGLNKLKIVAETTSHLILCVQHFG